MVRLIVCEGHVKIDDQLNGRHVETSREHVSCNNDLSYSLAELVNLLISFPLVHCTENNVDLVAVFLEDIKQYFCEIPRVDKNDRLSLPVGCLEHLLNEVDLPSRLALEVVLLHVV